MFRLAMLIVFVSIVSAAGVTPPLFVDTTLFTIQLNADSSSLYYSSKNEPVRRCLAGPIVMADNNLLFYSENGYLLFDTKGELLDSHSLLERDSKENRAGTMRLAYPVDRSRLLYFAETESTKEPLKLYEKELFKKRLKEIKTEDYPGYAGVSKAIRFNIAHNTVTDEMANRSYRKPQLVGYDGTQEQQHWWSLDRYYSFSSPLIHEKKSHFASFFPGVKTNRGSDRNLRGLSLDALATYSLDGKQYYVGVFAAMGNKRERYNQTLYICDEAGNVLYADTLLKQETMDEIIGKDSNPYENLFYTAKATKRFVFPPSVSPNGNIFYGIADYETRTLTCLMRRYARMRREPTLPDLANQVDIEKTISFEPVSITCNTQTPVGAEIPNVFMAQPDGTSKKAISRDLTRNEYLCRITRTEYRNLSKKLSRRNPDLSTDAQESLDSLSRDQTTDCPYTISLSGPRGVVASFDYPARERVLCARVIGLSADSVLVVRVDLDTYAEAMLFSADGKFLNRFTFNTQPFNKRSDILVTSERTAILEEDFEGSRNRPKWFAWTIVP